MHIYADVRAYLCALRNLQVRSVLRDRTRDDFYSRISGISTGSCTSTSARVFKRRLPMVSCKIFISSGGYSSSEVSQKEVKWWSISHCPRDRFHILEQTFSDLISIGTCYWSTVQLNFANWSSTSRSGSHRWHIFLYDSLEWPITIARARLQKRPPAKTFNFDIHNPLRTMTQPGNFNVLEKYAHDGRHAYSQLLLDPKH